MPVCSRCGFKGESRFCPNCGNVLMTINRTSRKRISQKTQKIDWSYYTIVISSFLLLFTLMLLPSQVLQRLFPFAVDLRSLGKEAKSVVLAYMDAWNHQRASEIPKLFVNPAEGKELAEKCTGDYWRRIILDTDPYYDEIDRKNAEIALLKPFRFPSKPLMTVVLENKNQVLVLVEDIYDPATKAIALKFVLKRVNGAFKIKQIDFYVRKEDFRWEKEYLKDYYHTFN